MQNKGAEAMPRPLEVVKCKEGNKEYLKERPNKKDGRLFTICEYQVGFMEWDEKANESEVRMIWRLAKRAARDVLRVSWLDSVVIHGARGAGGSLVIRVSGKH